ncbi:MAG: nucleotidyltransferase domain-containing protein [Spirochaetota bacterium]
MIRHTSPPLSDAEQKEILDGKLHWLLSACASVGGSPSRIVAFGSAARGELREDSDVDIALLFRDEQTMSAAKRAIYASPRTDFRPIDLLFFTEEEFKSRAEVGGVCMLIRDEGRVLWGDK